MNQSLVPITIDKNQHKTATETARGDLISGPRKTNWVHIRPGNPLFNSNGWISPINWCKSDWKQPLEIYVSGAWPWKNTLSVKEVGPLVLFMGLELVQCIVLLTGAEVDQPWIILHAVSAFLKNVLSLKYGWAIPFFGDWNFSCPECGWDKRYCWKDVRVETLPLYYIIWRDDAVLACNSERIFWQLVTDYLPHWFPSWD